MRVLLGEEYVDFAAAMDIAPVRALRVNTLKMAVEEFERICNFKHEKLSFADEGYIFEHEHIGSHPLHASGAIYVQEPAAMAAVECTDILPGMKILDVCASPGGKTTQAAAKLGGEGIIVCNEIDPARAQVLAQNVERMGVRGAVVMNTDSAELGRTYKNEFDLVIVDAPCSGEGMMRKNPLAVEHWNVGNVKMCSERQREILSNVAGTVKHGGRLLYSTCTFAPEENEMQIANFLSTHPDFHLVEVSERVKAVTSDGLSDYGEDMKKCRRFYPHVSRGEGQFMALLERDPDCENETEIREDRKRRKDKGGSSKKTPSFEAEEKIIRDFLSDVLDQKGLSEVEKCTLYRHYDGSYSLLPDIRLIEEQKNLKSAGVTVGLPQKGRVIPHHSFFMAYGAFFKRRIVLSDGDARIGKYLHGESIETDVENGFACVFYSSAPLGGAKVTSGEAKNYYPKGLRI